LDYSLAFVFFTVWFGWAVYAQTKKYSGVIVIGAGFVIALMCMTFLSFFIDQTATNGTNVTATKLQQLKPEPVKEVVYNSSWDGSVRQVKDWMNANFNDPKSTEFVEWSKVFKSPQGIYYVRCKYRAKNGFGALVLEEKLFYFDEKGNYIFQEDYVPS
jgi:hypothetical protein